MVRSTMQDADGTPVPPFHHLEFVSMAALELAPGDEVTLLPIGASIPTIVGRVEYFNGAEADPPPHPIEGVAGVIALRDVTDEAWLAEANRTGWFSIDVAVIYPRLDRAVALKKDAIATEQLPDKMKLQYLTSAIDGDADGSADAMTFEYCLPEHDDTVFAPIDDNCDVSAIEVHVLRGGVWHMAMRWHQY